MAITCDTKNEDHKGIAFEEAVLHSRHQTLLDHIIKNVIESLANTHNLQ
jgi:hypothetical protein